MQSVSNNNNAQPLAANGNFCPIVTPFPQQLNQGAQVSGEMLEIVSYLLVGGTGITAGTATFQALGLDGVWRPLATPAAVSFTVPATFNGSFPGPYHGIRIALTALAGGTIYAELSGKITHQ